MDQVVSQHDYKTDSPHENVGECSLWMVSLCFLKSVSRFGLDQPCWYLYKRDARWGPFSTLMRFFHVSSVWFSSAVSVGCSSLASAWCAPASTGHSFNCFFSSFFHQGFLSHGFVFITIIWNFDFDRHYSFIKCRPPYLLIVTLGGTIGLDMTLVDKSTPVGSFLLFVLDARMGGVPPVCPWSASCSLKILSAHFTTSRDAFIQYSILDIPFFCPKELGTARGKNESEGWLLTNLVICNVHCSTLFFFLTTWTAP